MKAKRLEDLSTAELERRFPPRRPPPRPVPHATEPVAIVRRPEAVPRLVPESKPVVRRQRRPRRAPEPVLLGARCGVCRRQWGETSRSTACPFCGAER